MNATALKISDLQVRAPGRTLLSGVSLRIPACRVTAVIGPSGAGKTTLLRCINRLATESDGLEVRGSIRLGDTAINLLDERLDGNVIRQRIGMIFQRPVVFPCSIADNVVFGARHLRQLSRRAEPQVVERRLREVSLWDEVADRLHRPAEELSAGQQQRLAIARALAVDPEMLLMDEATSALDPRSARSLEGLIRRLANDRTIVLVSHDLAQARRVADWLALLSHGELVEQGPTEQLFSRPAEARTRDYLREPGRP